ncbi:MAG: M42 family metallopeptidase [Bdellovibrionota bacterium]
MAQLIKLLKEVSEAHGAPGHEDEPRNIFIREVSKLGNLIEDRLGGCAVRLKNSSPKAKRKIFLGAHFDEVGFIVQNIRPDGYLQFHELGAWWGHAVMSQRLRIRSRKTGKDVVGVVCSVPPHLLGANKDKVINIQDMFIDIGATSSAEVAKMGIKVGDPIVPASNFTELGKGLYMGKAFDNRAGVTVAIEAAKELSKLKLNAEVYVGCTVQEEMGLRGAHTLAHLLDVDDAILLEGAPADDTPGLNPLDAQTKIGKGVQVRIMDRSAIMSRQLVDHVLATAEKKKIPTQVAVRRTGGTDAGGFSLTRHGSRCCVLSTPCRYIHTHNAILNEKDLENCLRLSVEAVRSLV